MTDANAESRRIFDRIHDLTRELADLWDDIDEGSILTDMVVVCGVVNPAQHLSSVIFYTQPETPDYTVRGLLAAAVDGMQATAVASEIDGPDWNGDTSGWDGTDGAH